MATVVRPCALYASVMGWRQCQRLGTPLWQCPGPKKSMPLDWAEFYPLLRQLRHGWVRTQGTGELYQRFAQCLSRRQLGALVQDFRSDQLHAMKHIRLLWSGLAWSCDATEYGADGHVIIPVKESLLTVDTNPARRYTIAMLFNPTTNPT